MLLFFFLYFSVLNQYVHQQKILHIFAYVVCKGWETPTSPTKTRCILFVLCLLMKILGNKKGTQKPHQSRQRLLGPTPTPTHT